MDLELEGAMVTDRGCRREVNEDRAAFILPHAQDPRRVHGALVVVADGMGGHAAGELASQLAIDVVVRAYYELPGPRQSALRAALHQANRVVLEHAGSAREFHGMGTTCSALAVQHGHAYLAHVGDSRLYLLRGNELNQLTDDHSLVGELVRLGRLSKAEARNHPDRSIIVRALGTKPEVQVESLRRGLPLLLGDRLCACTDGLTDVVTDEEISAALARLDPWEACDQLVRLALDAGAPDNVTVGVFRVVEPSQRHGLESRPTRDLALLGAGQ